MIIGTGTDLIDIRRIEKTLDRFGERFTRRCFTEIEQAKSDRRKERAASYAKRYAAKEAGAKALGTGIARGVSWKEIGVVNLPGGKPTLELKGRALDWLARLTPEGMTAFVHISITDEPPYALANVIIEALPAEGS
ncbi:holo-ACP synthase [Hyphobacterium sp. HN65]|uniref:Holo-[acyl-carrier-protein] synthase n=1 Tax=Hyphobacterium lacteum TaxID=3116575 RepID=A0ABU7LMA5_9PROT|nr:holo-ACP synthase [Hyphobacterium sp. HN65]MEE2525055.1 holo-ACP synthase [Hyphobacterium sp. HN65]